MEEIKVGNHIRTKQGEITKIVDTNMFDKTIYKDIQGAKYYLEDIVKHSKNLKDLVKVGDVIRYKLKNLKHENLIEVKEYKNMKTGEKYLGVEGFYLEQIEILEILTKEQFERESYKVEEE